MQNQTNDKTVIGVPKVELPVEPPIDKEVLNNQIQNVIQLNGGIASTPSSYDYEYKVMKDGAKVSRIFFFTPEIKEGIMIVDVSPKGAVAALTGSLPLGTFWSAGEEIVDWNQNDNGKIVFRDYVPKDGKCYELKEKTGMGLYGEPVSKRTIIVPNTVMSSLLKQMENKKINPENGYTILDLGKPLVDYDENMYSEVMRQEIKIVFDKEKDDSINVIDSSNKSK